MDFDKCFDDEFVCVILNFLAFLKYSWQYVPPASLSKMLCHIQKISLCIITPNTVDNPKNRAALKVSSTNLNLHKYLIVERI